MFINWKSFECKQKKSETIKIVEEEEEEAKEEKNKKAREGQIRRLDKKRSTERMCKKQEKKQEMVKTWRTKRVTGAENAGRERWLKMLPTDLQNGFETETQTVARQQKIKQIAGTLKKSRQTNQKEEKRTNYDWIGK